MLETISTIQQINEPIIEMTQRNARMNLQEMVQEYREEGEASRISRHHEVCSKCEFYNDYVGMCDYLLHNGELRKCSGAKCIEKGIFKKSNGKRKVVARN